MGEEGGSSATISGVIVGCLLAGRGYAVAVAAAGNSYR